MPQELLKFTPSYCIVGIYRLVSDPHVRGPVWAKCKHGFIRGAAVAGVWTVLTYGIQHAIVRIILNYKPTKFSGLGDSNFFGYQVPMATYATFIFMSSQITGIIRFFLSRNLGIAKQRAWEQVVASRGRPVDFWGPYAEEWEKPPKVDIGGWKWDKWVGGWIAKFVVRNAITIPLQTLVPYAGIPISAMFKAVATARSLHAPYFIAKKMTPLEIATYMQERNLDYMAFGFTAALLEAIPLLGLLFSISNRVGAAMWAFDLEKRQELYRKGVKKPKPPRVVDFDDGTSIELQPAKYGKTGATYNAEEEDPMAGTWVDVKHDEGRQVVGGSFVKGEGVVADKIERTEALFNSN